jgi:methylmalonyl-CoA mutase
LKDLNFEGELNFNEFPPVTTEEWEEVIHKDLKGKDYKETLRWDTREGFESLPFYRSEDLNKLDHTVQPLASSANWSILEIVEDAHPSEANKQALLALENGAGGLDIRLTSERIASKEDLESLLNNIQLEIITLVFSTSMSSPKVIEWVQEIISDRNLNPGSLDIHFSVDIFSHAAQSGHLPSKGWEEDVTDRLSSKAGNLLVDTSIYANAGASLVQQLAFALAAGNEYLGVSSELGTSLSFRFSTGPLYFPEIAKYRAFRLLWGKVLEEYGIKDQTVNILSETASWNKTQNDAHNNLLRATTEAMSSAIGGCNGISIHRFDEHFNEQTPFASRIARNTQLILQEEAYLSKVSDPGAGSYYIEVLTEKIANKSWDLFQEIEANNGFYEGLKSGFLQQMISESRDRKIRAYKKEEESLIGVNKYQPDDETDISPREVKQSDLAPLDLNDFVEITPVKPLYLEAELQMGDA